VRAVNLLPRDDQFGGSKVPPLPVIVGCVGTVLVTAIVALLFLSASGSVASKRTALQELQKEYNSIPTPPPPSPVVSTLPQQRQTRVTALATVLGQRVVWDRLLREVSQVVPSDVWLVTLNALAPSLTPASTTPGTTSSAPTGFTLTGCTYSQDSVARFLARLQVVPDLSSMTLGKSIASDPASATAPGANGGGGCPAGMVNFVLAGNVRSAGSPS
jgi:Tfp pilus assembly protein PilN